MCLQLLGLRPRSHQGSALGPCSPVLSPVVNSHLTSRDKSGQLMLQCLLAHPTIFAEGMRGVPLIPFSPVKYVI